MPMGRITPPPIPGAVKAGGTDGSRIETGTLKLRKLRQRNAKHGPAFQVKRPEQKPRTLADIPSVLAAGKPQAKPPTQETLKAALGHPHPPHDTADRLYAFAMGDDGCLNVLKGMDIKIFLPPADLRAMMTFLDKTSAIWK